MKKKTKRVKVTRPKLSVIIPLRNTAEHNRGTKRLEDCLHSIRAQDVSASVEVIVSDFGSDKRFRAEHEAICKRFDARHIYTESTGTWNISLARNVGIRAATAAYAMTTDVDCIFAPGFMRTVIGQAGPRKIVHCRISDLPKDYDGRLDEFEWMAKNSQMRPPYCFGGCQAFSRTWAASIGGFDEDYHTWGAEDADFVERAKQAGLESVWIEREASFYHQWHESEMTAENRPAINENRTRLKLTELKKLPIERNDGRWGMGERVKDAPPKPKAAARTLDGMAVIVTTFMRDAALFDCVKSIRAYYPDIPIYVGDNGKPNDAKAAFCRKHKAALVNVAFDCGVGETRNAVMAGLPKDIRYVMICEDDALFTDETILEKWVDVLETEPTVGVVGGMVKKADGATVTLQHYEAWLYAKAAMLYIEKVEKHDWKSTALGVRYSLVDMVMNIFMMRRDVWQDQKWDADIKTWPEHEDFFLALKKNTAWGVAYTDGVSVIHRGVPYEGEFGKYRMRIDGLGLFSQKWGIEQISSSWHKEWGKPNPMRIAHLIPKTKAAARERHAEVAVCIKTFLRERTLFKTIDAIEKFMPYPYRLYIADDGSISDEKKYRYAKLEEAGHIIVNLPFDCGISVGRNALVRRTIEPLILMMDDDIMLQDPETVIRMRTVLEADDKIGLCSGMLRSPNGEFIGNENYQKGLRFETNGGILFRYPAPRTIRKHDGVMFVEAEQVVNFFMARREVFDTVHWDNRIKVEWEHIDFFLALKESGWKAAACLDACAIHQVPENDPAYNSYRRAAVNAYFYQKHGFHNVINRYQ